MKQKISVEPLDKILGKKFKVLDDGFIRIVDYMGGDESIVQAARVSYGKGTKKVHEDKGLIRYLMRHRHTTPFEMCEIKFHIRVPMDCWRQWIRHRTANVNEYSTRYSEAVNSCQTTKSNQWRLQSSINKQGSGQHLHELGEPAEISSKRLSEREYFFHKEAREIYEERLTEGVAREQARKDLPLSTYTEAYWKIDLHNLLHFLGLRMDSHAQYEIRQYANTIGNEIVSKWTPFTWEAFQDYRLNAMFLSARDIEMIKKLSSERFYNQKDFANNNYFGWFQYGKDGILKSNRERQEFEIKAQRLGIDIPWSI